MYLVLIILIFQFIHCFSALSSLEFIPPTECFISMIVFSNETDIDSNLDYVINLDKTIKYIMKHRKKMNSKIE